MSSIMPSNEKISSENARSDFVERVSVAGWKETFGEEVGWIRHCYKACLILLSGFCLYYTYQGIRAWFRSGYTDEIFDVATMPSLPFSNVTICAEVYFNETFLRQTMVIPEYIKRKLTNESLDEFYRQLTVFMSMVLRPRVLDPLYLKYFPKIIHINNPQLQDFVAFTTAASPSCQSILKRCWIDGKQFDCCERAVQSFDDAGVCYVIALNFDSDNAVPSEATVHQSRVGAAAGLTVEALLPLNDFPWLEEDAPNGFRVIVGPVPYTATTSPVAAPDKAETFIKVIPEKYKFQANCAGHNQLSMKGGTYMYYDPEGLSCMIRDFMKVAKKYVSCENLFYLHRPNSSISCKPLEKYVLESTFFEQDLIKKFDGLRVEQFGMPYEKTVRVIQNLEDDWKSALSDKARCPTHCTYWTYKSTASFIYLEEPIGDIGSNDRMYSKIHVYYADFGYRQHSQQKEIAVYLMFCDFGNVVGLYWGMSIVSFFHVLYYVPKYLYAVSKMRKTQAQRHVSSMSNCANTAV